MTSRIIRWLLTLCLVYGVFTETGIWTALSFLLVFVFCEATGYMIARWSWMLGMIEKLLFERS